MSITQRHSTEFLTPDEETEAKALIDEYGSYMNLYECLLTAGKLQSQGLIDKLVGVGKYDAHHKEAVKALQKAKGLLFYEPVSLRALINNHFLFSSPRTSSHSHSVWIIRKCFLLSTNFSRHFLPRRNPTTLTSYHCLYRPILTCLLGVFVELFLLKIPMTFISNICRLCCIPTKAVILQSVMRH